MISIGKLATNKCATLQGLKYGAISQNDYGSDIQIDVNNIQSDLNSFDYNRTLNNDNCFALKFKSLENPRANFILKAKVCRYVPYKTYSNTIKVIKKYENKIKG